MLDRFYSTSYGRARCREGPFGRFIEFHAELLARRGYSAQTSKTQFEVLRRFGRWMQDRQWGIRQFNEAAIEAYLAPLNRKGRWASRSPIELFLQELRTRGVVKTRPSSQIRSARDRVVEEFNHYLKRERGASPETIIYYIAVARKFVEECTGTGWRPCIRLLCPRDVVAFVERNARRPRTRMTKLCTPLRGFLRSLFVRGRTPTDLSAYVPSETRWQPEVPPPTLSHNELGLVLRSCHRTTKKGRRDYAVLLLLARLGLRAGEVVRLELDDLDWEKGEIKVRGKGRHLAALPIPHDVGKAIVAYLKHGRPSSSSRRVFVRDRAPYIGWTMASAVGRLVKRALERAGLRPAKMGSHLLRHTLATHLVQGGSSLSDIGQILRHWRPDTTAGYARLAFEQLKAAAAPWPGGAA